MMRERTSRERRGPEAGVSLVLVTLGLIVLLAVAGLAVDLVTMYVARSEAQRSADSAALAGAQEFVSTAVSTGLMTPTQVQPLAAARASKIAAQNLIIGRSPGLDADDFTSTCPPPTGHSAGCFDFSDLSDPRITVVVYAHLPTYFMRVFGVKTVTVSAKARAEAYNPSGTNGPNVTASCLKPWLLPNCDIDHPVDPTTSSEANTICGPLATTGPGGATMYPSYFVDPNNNNAIVNPGLTPTGVVGEALTIKPGSPSDAPAASKFWPVFLPAGASSPVCPTCAATDQANAGSNSAALYRENIECCSTNQITCGQQTVSPINGDMVGPTAQGVDCLIHENNQGSGQDTISLSNSLSTPFQIYAGSNNPYNAAGTPISSSDSLVTLPLYDGQSLCPGGSCPATDTVVVVGFLQIFVKNETSPQGTVNAYVINVAGCNGSGSTTGGGGPAPVPGAVGGSPVPVRLIH